MYLGLGDWRGHASLSSKPIRSGFGRIRLLANQRENARTLRTWGVVGPSFGAGLSVEREVAQVGLLEPGFFPLHANLPNDRAVERGVRRLPTGARPISLGGDLVDHRFAI